MSVYFCEGRGWKHDFTLRKQRYTSGYFKTKAEAKRAEAARREELLNPTPTQTSQKTPTDMDFLELANRRLDHVKAYNSERHYEEYVYVASRWIKRWGDLNCSEIDQPMIEKFVLERSRVSAYTANKEIRYLKATFNFGLKKKLVSQNPVTGLSFLPVDKKIKYVPPPQDIEKVLKVANCDVWDYLWVVRDTMGRISEINQLTWDDVDLKAQTITLYTRKKRGGHRTPRVVPMTHRLHEIMTRRHSVRDCSKPWVFWHQYWSHKKGGWVEGTYSSRHNLMRKLCERAGVKPFAFHALRHAGASLLDQQRVPLGTIQKILGHENRATTEIYLHSLDGSEREAMAAYEQASEMGVTHSHSNPHPNPHPNRAVRPALKIVKG
ncbi:MAG: site-specific integrase [Proteobacteria bacterium]|nr:site-specific integrase [Pseudomonadota bacterium]MBU4576421.1 site-specific integrase [Pseudomonadota bacterium]MBU4599106.1 site-specific integrase [Pseudomonadota bacterium]MBV1714841.1 site-specific integrase [Desulfarculus sp.]MBV1753121.1 site-specific integrase [Desulfarculus sp.]